MAQLIQMRQRIKVIETIKKITHAMRLIAMSTHSQLKHQQEPLREYKKELQSLFAKITSDLPEWKNPILHPKKHADQTELVILIGSQKGLCGSFNTLLFNVVSLHKEEIQKPFDLIVVGKKAVEYSKKLSPQLRYTFPTFSIRRIKELSQEITKIIIEKKHPYKRIIVFSNMFKSFFVQKPQQTTLVPFVPDNEKVESPIEGYIWPEPPHVLLNELVPQYIENSIYYLLFESLFSEHASRFLSMDTATRNAEGLLESTKLSYNKLRQAKITQELTELTGSLT